ncbi:MAG TPA: response regulator [Vicinamibacterales bacterium]|nr:response regulator [Vicinamibacterales bacterium]
MHILVADDEPPIAELLASVCARAGHRVSTATSAAGVVDCLRAHQLDLLVVDLDMADTGGLELIRQARHMASELPVIAMTMHPAAYPPEDVAAAGGADLLSKPFGMDQLGIRVALIEERRRYVTDLAARARDARASLPEAPVLAPAAAAAGRSRSPILLFERFRERRRGAA